MRVEDPEEKYLTELNEFGEREAEWYFCSMEKKAPCTMEPYLYVIDDGYQELVTSLIAPVVINNQFRGVIGIDVNLPGFQDLAEELSQSLFSGAARVTITSEKGLIMAWIIKSIVQPLYELRDRIDNLASAEGDLTHQLTLDTHAELISLSKGFNLFLQKLRDMINELKHVSQEVRQSSKTSDRISRDTNQKTSQQQLEISSVVTATNEMSATAHEVARLAQSTADGAKKSQDIIQHSQQTLSMAVDSVRSLESDMSTASSSISKVASRSEDINRIIDVIKAIAEQTNLV